MIFSLDSLADLELHEVRAELVTYQGRRAVRLIERDMNRTEVEPLAILSGSMFKDGVIETEIAGAPRADASSEVQSFARGFVGIAFRVQPQAERFEYFFLRPTNGRADDQLRRN